MKKQIVAVLVLANLLSIGSSGATETETETVAANCSGFKKEIAEACAKVSGAIDKSQTTCTLPNGNYVEFDCNLARTVIGNLKAKEQLVTQYYSIKGDSK